MPSNACSRPTPMSITAPLTVKLRCIMPSEVDGYRASSTTSLLTPTGNQEEMVRFLLQNKADAEVKGARGTPLALAEQSKFESIFLLPNLFAFFPFCCADSLRYTQT